jgi:hypothetical protein
MIAVLVSTSALAWAAPCLHDVPPVAAEETETKSGDGCCAGHAPAERADGDPAEEQQEDDGDDDPCSCPVPCSPCCKGAVTPALVPVLAAEQPLLYGSLIVDPSHHDGSPPDGAERDVIHVPRRAA